MNRINVQRNIVHFIKQSGVFFIILVVLGGLVFFSTDQALTAKTAYVNDLLLSTAEGNISVIITAVSTDTAVAAIESVGGQVTSELWLIDAAGAVIDSSQLAQLADYPGIISIVNNKGLETAQTADSAYQWEGWVTDRRNFIESQPLAGTVTAPLTTLLDGGVLAITDGGTGIILNMDGSLRSNIDLDGVQYYYDPAIGSDGTIYIAGKDRVYALNPDGSEIWHQSGLPGDRFIGLTPGADAVYVVNDRGTVHAFAKSDGHTLWQFEFDTGVSGFLKTPPTVASDGTVYALTSNGHLAAINPSNGTASWTFVPPVDDMFRLSPIVSADGSIYIFGESGHVFRVNHDGSLNYQYTANCQVVAQPVLGDNGELFVVGFGGTDSTGKIYALNPDGTVHFLLTNTAWLFDSSPVLSIDQQKLFAANKNNQLLAVDTVNGSLLWQHNTAGQLFAAPAMAPNGNVHLGDLTGVYEILTPDGLVVYRYAGFTDFRNTPAISHDGSVFFSNDKIEIVVLARRPTDWHETVPYVEPTDDPQVYKVASPLSIDLGADVAHLNGVTGADVGVAVVDSGVYFDQHTQDTSGANVQEHFLGQADFVGIGTCAETTPGTCFSDYTNSQDGFGHGSHVAGIIWNNVIDYYTGAVLGIAPDANVLSIRVLNDEGMGTYEDVIEGIQYVVANKDMFNIKVMNMSLSADATTPYFVDPMNRAVEAAWAAGIVVVAAAGNEGPQAETITVPGNDPYVITVGAVDSNRTPGYWADDTIRDFSSTGPTLDGFVKPDVIAPGSNVVSYMYNDGDSNPATSNSPKLVREHPDYSVSGSMFRMNGTSMSTAVASGVVALMLDADPTLTPDEIKYRLMYSAKTAVSETNELGYSPLHQGAGRVWAPDAVFGTDFLEGVTANAGMDINSDLVHDWVERDVNGNPVLDEHGNPVLDEAEIAFHYQGPVQRVTSDDGLFHLYYYENPDDSSLIVLGAVRASNMTWMDQASLTAADLTFDTIEFNGIPWPHTDTWNSGIYSWGGGIYSWGGGIYSWGGGIYSWGGGIYSWGGGINPQATTVSSTTWVGDKESPTAVSLQNIHVNDNTLSFPLVLSGFMALGLISLLTWRYRQ